ncbi:MAG: aspartate 1-decarboxylase [Planctomycetota bacterium]|nr:aspartate 1-decarboxylase [Planctomycetota bacterium]
MRRTMLKSKIHGARVTQADLNYMGSITIDRDLLEAVDLVPNEKVLIVNLENGARFETYAFEGKRGSGIIGMNGGTARHCQVGDRVLIMAFAEVENDEVRGFKPQVVFTDEKNRIAALADVAH